MSKILSKISNNLVKDSYEGNVTKNVFLFTEIFQESFDVGQINVSGRYDCFDVLNGKIKVQLEGRGDHTYISDWRD